MITVKLPYIKIDTPATTLLFKVDTCVKKEENTHYAMIPYKYVATMHYGKKLSGFDNFEAFNRAPFVIDRVGGAMDDYLKVRMPYSSVGMGMNKEVALIVDNADGTNVNRFEFVSATVVKGGVEFDDMPYARKGDETLVLTLKDEVTALTLQQFYTTFADSDVIACCQKLINGNEKSVFIRKISSLQCDLPDKEYLISTYDGAWIAERYRHQTLIKSGVFQIDSKTGASSPTHNPFFTVEGTGRNNNAYGFNLVYSGNHKEQVDINPCGFTRVITGMSDYLLNYEVKGGESFTTPQAIMVRANDVGGITEQMHGFILNHIINPDFAYKERPVLFNHWEGTGINFNEEILIEMADVAKEVGIELFVMDDGWFGERNDDTTSLGDWWVNRKKFPNGLSGLSKAIKDRGMKFGIWVEPEMICKDSYLYREHPEYAVEMPGREPIPRRNQLLIDMSNPKVVERIYNDLCAVFDECQPDYVKWDYNRHVLDIYSNHDFKSGEFFHKLILGTYKLLSLLTKRYPKILFESCSSGGCRYDLGMFFYTPQTWGSDNSNTWARTSIQCGTLTAYPQSTFGAHVTRDECMFGYKVASLEDRFNLNCVGAFGYEFDFRKFSDKDLNIMKEQVRFYKERRTLLQYGKYITLDNIFDGEGKEYSYIVVSPDKSEAILTLVTKDYTMNMHPHLYRLEGLDANAKYQVTMRPQANVNPRKHISFVAGGDTLMEYGIDFDYLADRTDSEEYGGISTRLYYIKKID